MIHEGAHISSKAIAKPGVEGPRFQDGTSLRDFAHSLVLLQIAEADGLAKGIALCLSLGHYMVDIQSDSLVFVNTIRDCKKGPWKLDFSFQHIRYLLKQLDYQLDHIFREGNKVMDCLENYGCDSAKSQ
ncbi:hypothetical protein M9H77_12009 [Catharanthus roseus]|uniref:Uncharacterized protein n=1 Tax=Catharanthus roseus TaxID=4058 RepID=A0ACC0BG48_CATRO|nr:hypothetical protein M9H77_12009 [Catharanthus roseus]